MEKEFDALEFIKEKFAYLEYNCENYNVPREELNILHNALTELQAIKEAKPSEVMENFNKLIDRYIPHYVAYGDTGWVAGIVKSVNTTLLKAQEFEKVSAIFKAKPFNMIYFVDEIRADIYKYSYADYKSWFISKGGRAIKDLLTEEEFELLMRHFEKNIQKQ